MAIDLEMNYANDSQIPFPQRKKSVLFSMFNEYALIFDDKRVKVCMSSLRMTSNLEKSITGVIT